ncbi:helix-turn-helix domain-containing protein [Capsulimonas corticalis]|nr:helix-turn-helix transcriptional regulator [Capsulimonas corticalis]
MGETKSLYAGMIAFHLLREVTIMPRGARLKTEDGKMNLVGPRVRQRRIALGLTHDAVCARVQISTGSRWEIDHRDLWKIEAQRRACTDIEVVELARALEIDVEWLLEYN